MSEFYFCVFCDTIVMALDQLKEHLSQHFTEEGSDCLSDTERQFVDNLVNYERKVSASMALMPKKLPKVNVQQLAMGCPTCDALIRCYDLISNRDNKTICHCGRQSDDLPLFKCIQCTQFSHSECIFKSGNGKCRDCQSKNFVISYLKCLPFEAQRDHCYQHLNYYPFLCQFKTTDGQMCGQKLITYNSCEKHLIYDHKHCLDVNEDKFDVLSTYFDYNPIGKIDDLINYRLNSKSNITAIPLIPTSPKITLKSIPIPDRYDCASNSGLSDGRFEYIANSDEELNQSFHYTTEEMVGTHSKSQSSDHRKRRFEAIHDHNYMLEEIPLDDGYDHSLDYIRTSQSSSKKRGRPKGSKNKSINSPHTLTPERIKDDISEPEEVVDLTHRRQYLNWFTQTKVTKYPYFPQKDDEVYYLPFGHELYKQEIMKRGLYNQSNRNFTMRFFNYDRIPARVAKIDFLFKERRKTETVIRCIYVTLRPYDEKYGTIIHVKYHDMEGVLDFMILKEHYEQSVQRVWEIGEHFRSIVDDKYWFGVIIGYNSADNCQISQFRKYKIKWHSNDAIEYLSPWDLEPIDPSVPFNHLSCKPITDTDRQTFFTRRREEWPLFDEERELRRLTKGLKVIYNMDKTMEFPILQDLTDSRYREKILYPVDMKTFIARIENHFYRRHLSIKYDIKFMEANIRKLVKSVRRDPEYRFDEIIAKRLKYHTKFVTALCLLFIDTHDCTNPYDLYPNIDDYLETHDVKCYSAKRVHLNMRKKHPNCLPAPHKRLPKRPQSFGDSAKTLKIFKALSNTETLNRAYTTSVATTSSSSKKKPKKTITATQSAPQMTQMVVPFNDSNELIVAEDEDYSEDEPPKFQICGNFNINNNNYGQNENYSSDVSRSDNEYQLDAHSNGSDDSDVDPDYQTTNYYKKNMF